MQMQHEDHEILEIIQWIRDIKLNPNDSSFKCLLHLHASDALQSNRRVKSAHRVAPSQGEAAFLRVQCGRYFAFSI